MVLHVALNHRTTYTYDRPVTLGPQVVRLRPAPHSRTPVLSYAMRVKPEGHFINWQQDPFGNYLARLVFPEAAERFEVEVDLVADLAVVNPFDFFIDPAAEQFPFGYGAELAQDLRPFLACEAPGPGVKALLETLAVEGLATVDVLVEVNRRLHEGIGYVIRMEPGVQGFEETLEKGSGSCRDSAWLLVDVLRQLGLAARFVSGYLIQLTADIKALEGPTGAEVDFTDLHAWAEVYVPGAGWIGLDPTSGLFAGEGHIPLACTPMPSSAAPITGMVGECEVTFEFAMSVTRVRETPRVTLPYSEAQWASIVALGHAVDAELEAGDVRLTMGGEPTFVSQSDVDAPEWNTDAVGPTKRQSAEATLQRLQERFALGGLLHYGQGKWYPGEQLPRWAMSVYWRRDGVPLWRDPAWVAVDGASSGATVDGARALIEGIAARLGLGRSYAQPVWEDTWYFLHREGELPPGMDPTRAELDDPMERERLARVFGQGLGRPTGYVLPLQPWNSRDGGRRWLSEVWRTRHGRLILAPGDSALGYRLPFGALPKVGAAEYPHIVHQDPFEAVGPLPLPAVPEAQPVEEDADGEWTAWPVRSALSVEPRDGVMYVFLPPVPAFADFVELVGAVEAAAAAAKQPVRLEGYAPPAHAEVEVIKVTPDPGVIEVNTQPSRTWAELMAVTEGLYEDAWHARLTTEKFMLDGRHAGTGGGNHIVVGGPTPADSPFLRRPDLLGSVVTYWQHHPSLSYLFSGLFIGPTSQAPRVDEARQDLLYELELALGQLPMPGDGREVPPWLVDRILRNLLVDVTGNTHRTEICIDKLYSPDSATGRLGLVEFRSFEMPPHARMSLAQQLLLRALIARFWRQPYRRPLARWGSRLHDRFMLPHAVWADFLEVLGELQVEGYPVEPAWFAPHLEFRFPILGELVFGDVRLELRQALEPWHVMGEEGSVGGTVRYVDSSLERLQVKVDGLAGDRYRVAVNGVEVPLRATAEAGVFVAGVRYRAWQPARAYHPLIPVDAPLVFDLVDTWTGRAVAGCTYHVAHPGGRSYDTFPVNAYEAEARRRARFFAFGHTPGPMTVRPARVLPESPWTVDLRFCRA